MFLTSEGSGNVIPSQPNGSGLASRKRAKPSSAAATTDAVDSPSERKRKSVVELLTVQQVPAHLRFNRFVVSHYRPPTNWFGCIWSLFYLHNETVNILTHAVPLVGILLYVPRLLPWSSITIPYLPTVHAVACLAPWIGSILYHLFMNHQQGYSVYKAVLTIDVVGIWVTQTAGGLITICATIFCFDTTTQKKILAVYTLLCVYCFYKATTAKCAWGRRFSFTAPFLVRMCMVALRAVGKGGGDEEAFASLVWQDGIAIVGAYIGATNIPERWFPTGALDLFFNSHHFMHILVVYAVYHMHKAATLDLLWMSKIDVGALQCNSNFTTLPVISL